ncbi:hypothetical protein E2320_014286 [Naja naja]|nr:hypothetical protein E2320_014286 [Naja naja]
MGLPGAILWLLAAVAVLLLRGGCAGSSRHSLCSSCWKVPEPSQGLPQFLSMIHLDDQPIARSDSLNSTMVPLVPWMKVEQAKIFMSPVRRFWTDLEQLSNLNPETGGFHTWQVIVECELQEDGSKGGFLHYSYDGMDFISFDNKTLRWRAYHPQAQKVKEKWDNDTRRSERMKAFLEEACIEKLQRCLSYKNKTLEEIGWRISAGIGAAVTSIAVILFLICWCWRRRTIVCQKTKSSLDDFPLEVLPSSPPSGREAHERLLESTGHCMQSGVPRELWKTLRQPCTDDKGSSHRAEGQSPGLGHRRCPGQSGSNRVRARVEQEWQKQSTVLQLIMKQGSPSRGRGLLTSSSLRAATTREALPSTPGRFPFAYILGRASSKAAAG